jgi:septation ring formation regulator EzrA
MSNETVTYSLETVLKEIKDSIKEVNQRFDKIDERLTKLEIGQADLKGDIKVLDEKIDGLTARVAYQEFTNRGILIALVVAILGGAAKLFGFFPNP